MIIQGSGLSSYVDVSLTSSTGQVKYDYEVLEWSDSEIKVGVSIPEEASMFEVGIYNSKSENILLQEIRVQLVPTT